MAKNSRSSGASQEPSLFTQESSLGARLDATTQENHDSVEEKVITVGNRLRMAREERNWSLHEVAEMLRLRAPQIQALEDGNYHLLPGQTFVTGFLRSYANLLDLDAVAIVDLYKQEHSDGLTTPSLAFPEPTSEGRIPGTGMLLGTLVFALVLVAGWFVFQESNNLDFERVAEVPRHLAEKVESAISEDPEQVETASVNTERDEATENIATSSSEPTNVEQDEITEESLSVTPSQVVAEKKTQAIETTQSIVSDTLPENVESNVFGSPEVSTETAEVDKPKAAEAVSEETVTTSLEPDETKVQAQPETTVVDSQVASSDIKSLEPVTPDQSIQTQMQQTANDDQVAQEVLATTYPQAVLDPTAKIADEDIESPLPRTFGVDNTTARIVLRARAETWIEVKPENGTPYLSRVLMPGDVYMAPNLPNLKMTTGNAGGLEIRVDGNEIASLGGNGKILRNISLVADSLLDGTSLSQ
jgi:cytoskeleton protein RodZ